MPVFYTRILGLGFALLGLVYAGVLPKEEAGQQCAGDAVIGAGYGTWNYGKGSHRVGGYHGGRCKEVACQHGCHACVLHAYFYGERTALGGVEVECLSGQVAKQVTGSVVKGDDGKCEQNQLQSLFLKLWMYGEDDAAHDACQAKNADAWHNALYLLKVFPFAQEVVEGNSECNGNECHQQDVLEHSPCIYFNLCTSQP